MTNHHSLVVFYYIYNQISDTNKKKMKKYGLLILLFLSLLASCGSTSTLYSTWEHESTAFESLPVIAPEEWKGYARSNRIQPRKGTSKNPVMVLGHYPEYVELTDKIQAESMQIPMEEWGRMTPEEQWNTTAGFLDNAADRGLIFRLATPLDRARPESFYVREVTHVLSRGFRVSPDGLWLVKE